ncbi:MAG: hypothetical protein HY000_22850, partial [Planctomycetes bacterium]|nr:hypothetical protein [Planctomycetota bacterium]
MAENLSAEQVRAAKLAAMPAPLGEVHYALYNEVAWIHLKWQVFRALFATSPERIDLLNEVAPAFFHHLQGVLWEDVLLHLYRLTDSPKSMGHANLTLRRLPALIPDTSLRAEVESKVALVQEKTNFARDWRNRHLAHRELPPLDGERPRPLAPASRLQVEEALASIRTVMNCIENYYEKLPVSYEHSIAPLGGAE